MATCRKVYYLVDLTTQFVIFSLIITIFGLIPAYFYIKNYDKNMQKYKEEQARLKAKGLSKYMKFIIYFTTILTIFTVFIAYTLNDMTILVLLALAFIYILLHVSLSFALHSILIIDLWILFVLNFFEKFIEKFF